MRQRASDALLGAVAGVIGASGMTILRMTAHRAGLIDQMVPQAVEQSLERRAEQRPPGATGGARALDQALHLGYGLALGAVYGAFIDRPGRRRSRGGRAVGYGVALWAFGSTVLLPALRIARPPWRKGARENAVDLAAHVAYAGITAFVASEFAAQADTSPRAGHPRLPARVG